MTSLSNYKETVNVTQVVKQIPVKIIQKIKKPKKCDPIKYRVYRRTWLAKLRMKKIKENLSEIINSLKKQIDISDKVESMANKFIQSDFIRSIRSKRYQSIASAILIHSLRANQQQITLKKYRKYMNIQEMQVKRVLYILQSNYSLKATKEINIYIKNYSQKLGLTQKFIDICSHIHKFYEQHNAIDGEHENSLSASIIKIAGDIVFHQRGGFQIQSLANLANCGDLSIKLFLRKVEPLNVQLLQTLIEDFGQ